jgi:hypothetical protein
MLARVTARRGGEIMNNEVLAAIVGGAVGTLLGFFLSVLRDRYARKQRQRAHITGMLAELKFCADQAGIFLRDKVQAPLYRLPTLTYQNAFPTLLADGAMSGDDIDALIRYFGEVETLNRGLGQAESQRGKDDKVELAAEHGRNCRKAERLVENGTSFEKALRALQRHIL